MLQYPASDPKPAHFGSDRHLRELIHSFVHGNQSNTADGPRAKVGHKDLTALAQDPTLWIVEIFTIHWFQCEVAGDPLLVQCPESIRIHCGLEKTDLDLWRFSGFPCRRNLHSVALHVRALYSAVSLQPNNYVQYLVLPD